MSRSPRRPSPARRPARRRGTVGVRAVRALPAGPRDRQRGTGARPLAPRDRDLRQMVHVGIGRGAASGLDRGGPVLRARPWQRHVDRARTGPRSRPVDGCLPGPDGPVERLPRVHARRLRPAGRRGLSAAPHPDGVRASAVRRAPRHGNTEPAVTLLQRAVSLSSRPGWSGRSRLCPRTPSNVSPAWVCRCPRRGRRRRPRRPGGLSRADPHGRHQRSRVRGPRGAGVDAVGRGDRRTVVRLPEHRQTQLRSLYRKLGVHSRADALTTATRLGLLASRHDTDG